MRLARLTGESLSFTPNYINSDEIRSDRMLAAPVKVMQASEGGINFELSYPDDDSPESDMLRSAFFNTWVNTPTFFNDGTADSVITDAGTTANTYVVTSGGASVKLGHLVRATGFTNSANNQIFRAASSTGTTIVGTALSLVAEAVPPGTAKLKVVGFQGAAGDIAATATGLGSTALDFTTLGLVVGQWVKVGGTAAGDKFATAVLNDWMRVTAIAATALTLDNRPSGWTTDAGAAKTIKGSFAFMGMGGSQSTTTLDASPDAATTGAILAGNAHVGRVAEAGVTLGSPNWARQLDMQISNSLRAIEAVDSSSPVGINPGECAVTGRVQFYFGDNAMLAKLYAGTLTSINARVARNSQALIFAFPSVTITSGAPVASAKNQDVVLDAQFSATLDSTTGAQALLDRLDYWE
jgi:hypothetical protein